MAKITFIPMYQNNNADSRRSFQCPYGVRDLTHDECYSGNGRNRCKYFVRYDWENHYGCVACTHPPLEQKKADAQLGFNFD